MSEATVSRFVKAMGYENYRAFQLEVTKSKAERRKGSLEGIRGGHGGGQRAGHLQKDYLNLISRLSRIR